MSADQKKFEFGEEQAAAYDAKFAALDPIKAGLHLVTRFAFGDLPTDARILCVGAGTGAEVLYLAAAFPGWSFTAVDPSAPMLALCRKRLEAAGALDRCALHVGRLDTLPETAPFDGATAHFVSHFITDGDERRAFFADIAARLKPGGGLVSADIAGDMQSPEWTRRMALWAHALRLTGSDDAGIAQYMKSMGSRVAVTPLPAMADLIVSAGFAEATHVFGAMHMHAWHSRTAE